jgi:hypothetical protein
LPCHQSEKQPYCHNSGIKSDVAQQAILQDVTLKIKNGLAKYPYRGSGLGKPGGDFFRPDLSEFAYRRLPQNLFRLNFSLPRPLIGKGWSPALGWNSGRSFACGRIWR